GAAAVQPVDAGAARGAQARHRLQGRARVALRGGQAPAARAARRARANRGPRGLPLGRQLPARPRQRRACAPRRARRARRPGAPVRRGAARRLHAHHRRYARGELVAPRRRQSRAGMNPTLLRRTLALVAASVIGFVALAALDAWRTTPSAFDRFGVWTIGFAIARALGVWAGAPLRRPPRRAAVTRGGLLDALLVTCGGFLVTI